VDVNNPQQLQQQLTNPATSTLTANAVSQALAAAGNNCRSTVGQAIARELPAAEHAWKKHMLRK
jgi:hypothetical protein